MQKKLITKEDIRYDISIGNFSQKLHHSGKKTPFLLSFSDVSFKDKIVTKY